MKIFLEIIRKNIKLSLQYKTTFFMSMLTQPLFFIMNIAVFTSLYRQAQTVTLAGYNLGQMVWYMSGIPFIWSLIWNGTDWNIAEKILSGDLTQDLLRPVTIFQLELGEAIGHRILAVFFEFLPNMIILPLFYFPDFMTIWSVLRFIPVAIGAFLLFFHINFLIGLLSFAMKSMKSIGPIRFLIVNTLGGGYLPLGFFPPVFQTVNSFLPFQYIFYQPLQVFLNMESTQSAGAFLTILGAQAAWILVLHLLSRLFWNSAYKHFCAVGG